MKKLLLAGVFCCISMLSMSLAAFAQSDSQLPLRIVLGVAPGGSLDTSARSLGLALQKVLSRPVVIENKPGANMLIATRHVIGSRPDGDVLLMGTGTLTLNPLLHPKENVDPLHDMTPVAMLAVSPMVVAVPASLKINTIEEFVAYAKENPGKLNFSAGTTGFHLAGELFMKSSGLDMMVVPYSGAGPALNAMLAGDVQATVLDEGTLNPHIKSGRVRALVISSNQRSVAFPDVPTGKEAGLNGFDIVAWSGLFAPPGTSPETVNRLHDAVQTALSSGEMNKQFSSISYQLVKGSIDDFKKHIASEMDIYRQLSQSVNLLTP